MDHSPFSAIREVLATELLSIASHRERNADVVQAQITGSILATSRPTGGIVAAPTTSLPERIGGKRNWDYRYCWLRDATFSLLALMNGGHKQEARAWREWLLRAVAGDPSTVQIMYGVTGERRLDEWTVPWLGGFAGSSPVRIGNAAARQPQIDIYGELMDTLHHARCGGLATLRESWDMERGLIAHLEKAWREPDNGIWEMRGPRRHFTHSKVMAWVAFDRAIKSAARFGLDGPVAQWRAVMDEIRSDVLANGYDDRRGVFVQHYGSQKADASLLLLPLVGFITVDDPRMQRTMRAIELELIEDGLVRRYDTGSGVDGLSGEEGVFLPCSLWLADNYILAGRRQDALRLLDRVGSLCNDVGLLSEEYDTRKKRLVGNFPQAFFARCVDQHGP